jgi:hypothetical protein
MRSVNRLSLLFILSSLAVLGACGGGGSHINPTPPPSGGFTPSSLNGTYVFSTSGVDSTGVFITIVGAFTANGSGGITAGTVNFTGGNVGTVTSQPLGGGSSYIVNADGRGTATLATTTILGKIGLDFVLTSSNHGLVSEFDSNGTGSGTLDLQTAVSQAQLAGSFAFALAGSGPSNASFATVGALTLTSSGNVTAGVEDFNNGGSSTNLTNVSIATSSTVLVGTGTTPGTAQLSNSTAAYSFAVYPISATHLKLIETDGLEFTSGDLLSQQASLPSGTLVFTMAGFDSSGLPLAAGGFLPTDASGNITAGIEDFNDGGNAGQATSVSGSFSTLTGGRSQLALNSFENGGPNGVPATYTFAAYPSLGGTLLLEIDGAGITGGVALVQSSTSLAVSQGYGLNLSAVNTSGVSGFFEEDDIAEFTTTSAGFSGIVDFNDEGTLAFGKALAGTYSISSGRGTSTSNSGSSTAFNITFYAVDGKTFLFIETDNNQIGTGTFELQNPGPLPALASPHAMGLSRLLPHGSRREGNK